MTTTTPASRRTRENGTARSGRPAAATSVDRNEVLLVGAVRADPDWYDRDDVRTCCFDLEIREGPDGAAVRVPVAWADPPRQGSIIRTGSRVVVRGAFEQRFFRSGGRTVVRAEVRAVRVVSARNKAAAQKAIAHQG